MNLADYELSVFSQFTEDGLTQELVRRLDPPKYFLEIGCADVGKVENNCYILAEAGWSGWFFDQDQAAIAYLQDRLELDGISNAQARRAFFTVERAQLLCSPVPRDLGVLSIDVDGNDYWIWKALCTGVYKINPRIVIIEAQMQQPPEEPFVSDYDPHYVWDHKTYDHGASVYSLVELGKELGYHFVGKCPDYHSPNLFFVKEQYKELVL